MTISRRKFVQLSSLASTSLLLPKFLKAFDGKGIQTNGKKLVVIQLSGGNDGLNTVIPVRNDIYYSSRPKLAIPRADALSLSDDIGLNPALKSIRALYDEGFASILNGVGYPQPDRSHFRSMDIWQTGSTSDELVTTGWIGRYMDEVKNNNSKAFVVEADDTLSLTLKGMHRKGIAVKDVNQFYKTSKDAYFNELLKTHNEQHEEQLADYLYGTLRETGSAASYIYEQTKIYSGTTAYPDTQLGKRMKTIGSLINSGADTKVYYISHGSFDTHVNQKKRQEDLFGQLDGAVAALVADLKAHNNFNDVLIMTFSEFGRRVAQNASEGTDHGTASNMFFISGSLKKAGLYNELPSLADLDNGDLKYSVDFKQAYATVLDHWLDVKANRILDGNYQKLSFI